MREEDYFLTICHQVFKNWSWLEKGERCSQQWLSKHFYYLYQHIRSTTFYKQKSRIYPATINKNKGYSWIPIFTNNKCRAGLLYILPNGKVPLHDHKESIGISMILDGKPSISKCHLSGDNKNILTLLKSDKIIEHKPRLNELNFIFPRENNIHGFSSNHLPSLLFNIVFFKEKHQRNYYIPKRDQYRNNNIAFRKWLPYSIMINFALASSAMGTCNFIQSQNNNQTEITKTKLISLINCSKSGNIFFQFQLAELYNSGTSIKQNFYEAYYWYLKAAKNGHIEAQYQVGIMLLDGQGVTEDSFKALDWLSISSQNGHIQAKNVLNYILENPEPLEC